jgi:hypothetical protein
MNQHESTLYVCVTVPGEKGILCAVRENFVF